jgi:hypothetical protein
MAEIPTMTMWSPEGKPVRVNQDDGCLQKILQEAGYTLEAPETAPVLPPEANPEGEAAQDQAAGEVLLKDAIPGAAKGEYYDIKTKTTKKK